MPADVMCCEAEAGAATPKVRPCRTLGHPRTPHRTAVVLVARCCARARAWQTCALTRGRRCKPVRGLSEGPPSCYCLWFECVVGQGGRVLRTHSPGGQTLPKSLLARAWGDGRAESGRPASGRRTREGWSPCPGRASVGLWRCVEATTSTSTGTNISSKKLVSAPPRAPAWIKCSNNINF